jgi:hypothetical protein
MGLVYNPETGQLDEVADDEIDSSNYGFGYGSETAAPASDYDFWADIGIDPDTTMENWKSPSNAQIESALQGDATFMGLVRQYGSKALDLLKTDGKFDLRKLASLAGGAYAASQPSRIAPTGYQGKIPTYTAETPMLTAPPAGRRPGSGGINYGGNATFRDTSGNVVGTPAKTISDLRELALMNPQSQYNAAYTPDSVQRMNRDRSAYWDANPVGSDFSVAGGVLSRTGDNAATFKDASGQTYQMNRNESFADIAKNIPAFAQEWEKAYGYKALAKGGIAGGLEPEGFVVPADVVSHAGNGSSEAGLKLLAQKYGAEPIKGEGDGMSDSIPTTIGGKQEARVANDEAFIPPEMVKRIGGGDAKKGAKKLYAMMDTLREERTGTKKQGKQIDPEKFMPGGSVDKYVAGGTTTPVATAPATRTTPASATGTESSLSNWAGDYVTDMMGRGRALAQAPYQAYTGPLTAGPSALQQRAFDMALGTAPSGMSTALDKLASYSPSGGGGASATNVSSKYVAPEAYKPGEFSTGIFGTEQAQQYMNPYLQSALEPQMAEARRQADIMRIADAGRLTKAGAFGGSRQAIMESEGNRNLMDKQNQMLTSGYSTAFDKAMQQFNADQLRQLDVQRAREQAGQFGYGQSSDQAKTAAMLGLQADTANQAAGLTAAQINSAAATAADANRLQALLGMGNLGLAQLNQLSSLGGIQRGIESEGIAADRAQFEEARLNPFKMLQFEQSLLSGMPVQAQSYNMPGLSGLQQFSQGATTVDQALRILSGQTAAAKKP